MRFNAKKFMQLRVARRLSMADLAKLIGVSVATVGQWEGNAQRVCEPRKKYYQSIATALHCAITDFTDDAAPVREVSPVSAEEMRGHLFPVLGMAAAATLARGGSIPPGGEIDDRVYFADGRPGDFVVRVDGGSMLPWYPAGTRLLCREVSAFAIANGMRVVALVDGEVYFKVFVRDDKCLGLLSINREDGQDLVWRLEDVPPDMRTYRVVASQRNELDIDNAMFEKNIRHFWQDKIAEMHAKEKQAAEAAAGRVGKALSLAALLGLAAVGAF